MGQVSLRLDDALLTRVRSAASRRGRSVNRYIVEVLSAATDPALVCDEAERVRERLRAAGLLEEVSPRRESQAPSEADVEAARRRAGAGTPLSDLVSGGRR